MVLLLNSVSFYTALARANVWSPREQVGHSLHWIRFAQLSGIALHHFEILSLLDTVCLGHPNCERIIRMSKTMWRRRILNHRVVDCTLIIELEHGCDTPLRVEYLLPLT